MARDWKTTYAASAAAAQHQGTFTSPAVAGHGLVAIAAAPATVAPPNTWTEVADALGTGELDGAVLVAAGGEASILWDRAPASSTAPRTLAGWIESRNDIGPAVGTPINYNSAVAVGGALDFGSIAVPEDGCRIYVALSQVDPPSAWTPAWTGASAEDTFTAPGVGFEPVRLAVASVAAPTAGSYPISVSGLPSSGNPFQAIIMVLGPAGEIEEPPPAAETVIEAENRLAGTASGTWDITGAGSTTIQGYATAMSVARGSTLSVKVHSPAASWTGKVYRLGYYGGAGAREIDSISGPQTTQPDGTVDPTTLMASCANWSVNGSWNVPADATPGVYLIKIQRSDNAALASHIGPFVVRNPARKAPIVVKLSDSTWQAYNHVGATASNVLAGRNLYGIGTASEFTFNIGARAKAVSYDRPFVTRQFIPQTWYFNAEYPLHRFLERLGYDVDYVTCGDVENDPSLLLGRDLVVSAGHDEYWSPGMVTAAQASRDHGSTPASWLWLSGNEVFWRINWANGLRSFNCWKDSHDGALNSTGVYGGTWQDTRGFNPDRRPAALLNGQRFRLNGIPPSYALGANAAHAGMPIWRNTAVAALTGSQTWTSPGWLVGFEADEPADTNPAEHPAGLLRLSQITHNVAGLLADDNGAVYTGSGSYTHAITAFPSAGGAVVHFGTVQLAWALDDTHDRHPGGSLVSPALQQAVCNVIADLGQVPPEHPFPDTLVLPSPVSLSTYGFPETTPPNAPSGLQATPGQTQIALAWTASTDNVGVTGYNLYRNGTLVATGITATTYTFTGLTAGTSYTLGVRAKDAADNQSTLATITASTTNESDVVPGAYATIGDLNGYLGSTPANARQLLIRASRAVDRALLTAVYDPTSVAVKVALRDAVLEHIAGTRESGDLTGLGVASAPQSFTIGKLSVQRGSSASSVPTTGGLVDQAYAILQAAGLTGHGPAVIG
ncbi:fibronectin type III domain-containing protein [Actinoplanes sp. Pm04-4]|uniref:Fibronectin type III domain-containing protein n=1 Tax=Paractinoplanes pyxinae TaxID=2997416 RepID=A0ABT4B4G0_9ACTN|nr:fibronectin type III domain-containing protein [Actinoplanes pyxinae]MCY1141378.1 fibronectin type III domain-containing protein [Actinoplanes pyxinae]